MHSSSTPGSHHPSIVPHVLCGGFGTRLWPMSREAYPKQFVPLINGRSLLARTLERAASSRRA